MEVLKQSNIFRNYASLPPSELSTPPLANKFVHHLEEKVVELFAKPAHSSTSMPAVPCPSRQSAHPGARTVGTHLSPQKQPRCGGGPLCDGCVCGT